MDTPLQQESFESRICCNSDAKKWKIYALVRSAGTMSRCKLTSCMECLALQCTQRAMILSSLLLFLNTSTPTVYPRTGLEDGLNSEPLPSTMVASDRNSSIRPQHVKQPWLPSNSCIYHSKDHCNCNPLCKDPKKIRHPRRWAFRPQVYI